MKEKSFLSELIFYLFITVAIVIIVISQSENGAEDDKKIVAVHVKGAVNAPGYYELEYGKRVKDAIGAAGGELTSANLFELNIARKLVDGEEIIVPFADRNEEYDENQPVNINTADLYLLCKLEGISESLAIEIIDYRTENGPFSKIEDLKEVNGIGDMRFNTIKNNITVK